MRNAKGQFVKGHETPKEWRDSWAKQNTDRVVFIDKVCPTCKKSFTVPNHLRRHIYCSKLCSARKNSKHIICDFCEREFRIPPSRENSKRFCSPSCRSNWTQAKQHNMTNSEWLAYKEIYYENHRKSRTLSTYKTARRQALKRDSYQCTNCPSTENLHAHHIKPVMLFPELIADIDNLITLCQDCHKSIHRGELCLKSL